MDYPRRLKHEMVVLRDDYDQRAGQLALCCRRLTGRDLEEPFAYDHTLGGFNRYLKAHGTGRFFKAREICTPRDKRKAKRAGYTLLLPPRHAWPWAMLVVAVADGMRRIVGTSVTMRNLWRPHSYNQQVAKSGIRSDHPNACGADLDFQSVNHRRKAEGYARGLHCAIPELEISLGMGSTVLHVGVMSPQGSRHWFYSSYKETRVSL
jgi:hypothetical protein